jgi:hypothetical protein
MKGVRMSLSHGLRVIAPVAFAVVSFASAISGGSAQADPSLRILPDANQFVFENTTTGTTRFIILNFGTVTAYVDTSPSTATPFNVNTSFGLGDPKDVLTSGTPVFTTSAPIGSNPIPPTSIDGLRPGDTVTVTIPWVTAGPDFDANQNSTQYILNFWASDTFNTTTNVLGSTGLKNYTNTNTASMTSSVTVADVNVPEPGPLTLAAVLGGCSLGIAAVKRRRAVAV